MSHAIKYDPAGHDGLVQQPKLKVMNPKDWQRTNENPAETLAAHEERARELKAGQGYHKEQAGGALSALGDNLKGLVGGSKKHNVEDDASEDQHAAHHHESIIDKMGRNFHGGNTTSAADEARHATKDADYAAEHHGNGGILHNAAEVVSHTKFAAGDGFKSRQHAGYVKRHGEDANNFGEEGEQYNPQLTRTEATGTNYGAAVRSGLID